MVTTFAANAKLSDELRKEYQEKLNNMELKDIVREFISYLDYTEETDSGREFHPITIGSCRILMTQPLGMCLNKLRESVI